MYIITLKGDQFMTQMEKELVKLFINSNKKMADIIAIINGAISKDEIGQTRDMELLDNFIISMKPYLDMTDEESNVFVELCNDHDIDDIIPFMEAKSKKK